MKAMIEAGAAGVTLKISWRPLKNAATWAVKCWFLPVKLEKLNAARLAADIMGVPTVILARTDAEAADLLTRISMKTTVLSAPASAHSKVSTVPNRSGTGDLPWSGLRRICRHDLVRNRQTGSGICAGVCRSDPREIPGKLLAYNCSPSFNWKKNLDDATIAKFQKELGAMGYKFQFITLAGFHS
jgi:isocitrate lyase